LVFKIGFTPLSRRDIKEKYLKVALNAITITHKKVAHDILIITHIPMYKDELINGDENKCC
jgi:hypothetical protein